MILGIEIGGTKLQLCVGKATSEIIERRRFTVDRPAGAAGIRQDIECSLAELLRLHKITAIGVGFGGPVDWKTGRIARSHHIEGWSGFDLAGWLREGAGLPTSVENDANAAALGEAVRGAGTGFNPVFYVTLGSGVGGGLVVDGQIYHGAKPGESELGHILLDRQGTILESRCSGWAVDARIRELKAQQPDSILSRLAKSSPGGEAKHLVAALTRGDSAASQLLQEIAADLAFGLSHAVHLFHPEIIILGGGLSRVGEPFRSAVEQALSPLIMDAFRPAPCIALAALGEDTVPLGAMLLAEGGTAPKPLAARKTL